MTNTTDDIAARLREYAYVDLYGRMLIDQAADTIDRLTRERDEAMQTAAAHEAKWQSICRAPSVADTGTCACSYDNPDDVCMHHSPKLTTAEAALAVAREALDEIKAPRGIRWRHDQTEAERTEAWRNHIKTLQGIARAALDKITKEPSAMLAAVREDVRMWQLCEAPEIYNRGQCCGKPDACIHDRQDQTNGK